MNMIKENRDNQVNHVNHGSDSYPCSSFFK